MRARITDWTTDRDYQVIRSEAGVLNLLGKAVHVADDDGRVVHASVPGTTHYVAFGLGAVRRGIAALGRHYAAARHRNAVDGKGMAEILVLALSDPWAASSRLRRLISAEPQEQGAKS